MAFAQGSRTGVSYAPETVFGTTPASPSLTALPYNTFSINLNKDRIQSGAITPDRMIRYDRHGNRQVAGEITTELTPRNYDTFLEAALMGTWTTNVLKIGTTLKSFTIEDGMEDINQFRIFTGCAVSSMAISVRPNAMVDTTFTFVGKDMTTATVSPDPSKTAAFTLAPFDSCSGSIKVGNAGVAPTAIATITGIDLQVDNGLAPTFVVGDCTTPQLEVGMANVTGTITAYFEDISLYTRFLNETETAVEFTLSNPTGNAYTFLIPRAKFNTAEAPVSGPTSRIITIQFAAIYDATEATLLKITRPTFTP